MSRQVQITFDCRDPRALSSFWRDVLGYVHPGPPGVALATDDDPLAAWDEFLARIGVPESERNGPRGSASAWSRWAPGESRGTIRSRP